MTGDLNPNKVGLVLGTLSALFHAVWALSIALMPSTIQMFLDWIFEIHFIKPIYVLDSFVFTKAAMLVSFTFFGGFLFGWIFSTVWNKLKK